MTTVAMSHAPNMTSDATFRTWGSAISAAMAAIGWVKVTDAAQINWTTVTKPAVANTAAGYEVWGMNDSLQATAPVYLKIEYGCGSATSYPCIWITLGTGQDGAGTLTGQVSTRKQSGSSGNTTAQACWFSGTSSRLTMVLWPATYSICVFVERSHDSAGANTSAGMQFISGSSQLPLTSQYIPFSGVIPAAYTGVNCCSPPAGNGTYMTNVMMYPIRTWGPGEMAPFIGCSAYFNADIGAGSQITATNWDGTTHNVYATGSTLGGAPSYGGSTVWAVMYE